VTSSDIHLVYRPSILKKPSLNNKISETNLNKCCPNFRCKPAYSRFQGRALKNIFYSNSVSEIDIIARTIYPLAFFIFNLIYWSYYLYASQQQAKGEK